MKRKLAVMVSGGGTDFQSVVDAIKRGEINAEIVALISSKEGVFALERAKREGITSYVYNKRDYPTVDAMYDSLILLLKSLKVDYIILAGYLTVLTPNIVSAFRNKIINIHPALIPAYSGKGFYGMRVHNAVIANKEKVSGATVHIVDEGTDTGKILAQETVPVYEDDTPEILQQRVLELEHKLLPKIIARLCED